MKFSPPDNHRPATHPDSFVVLEPSTTTSQFRIMLVISVIAATTGFLLLLAPNLPWVVRIFLIAIVLLTLRFWGGFAVLLAIQVDLFFREPLRSSTFQGPLGVLTVCIFIGLLMFINRNRSLLQRAARRPLKSILGSVASALKGEVSFDPAKAVREIPQMLGSVIRGTAIIAATVFCSRIVLAMLPTRRTLNRDLQLWFLDEGSLERCTLLIVSMVAIWIVCNEISWRQLTRDQAKLYVRSVFLTQHHTDLRMIVRRRLKLRLKAARRRGEVDVSSPPEPVKPQRS